MTDQDGDVTSQRGRRERPGTIGEQVDLSAIIDTRLVTDRVEV